MNKIICFIDMQENYSGELEEYIVKLDEAGYVIYLHTDIILQAGEPIDVLYNLDIIKDGESEEDRYIFFSNMFNLTQFVYRVYHQVFDAFIYFEQGQAREYPLKGIYKEVLDLNIASEDGLNRPIYTNSSQFKINNYLCKSVDISLFPISWSNPVSIQEQVKKIYCIEGKYYLFEPLLTEKFAIIGDSKTEKNKYPEFHMMNYVYLYNSDVIEKLLTHLEHLNSESLIKSYELLELFEDELARYHTFTYNMTCLILDDISLEYNGINIVRSIFLLSFLMKITKKSYYVNRFLKYTIESEVLSCDNHSYLWKQINRYRFANEICCDESTDILLNELYQKTYNEYKVQLKEEELTPIPIEERNKDTIVVFAIQMLSIRHAPTRTTLERCYTLAKNLGKKILLINTKEQVTSRGMLLLYQSSKGNIIHEYSQLNSINYKDCDIPFYQPEEPMPSIDGIRKVIQKVRQLKPYFMLSIGNANITADLCGNITPLAAVSIVFSSVPTTMATFSVIGRTLSDLEWDYLIKKGYKKENIIESIFTFDLIPKSNSFTRKDFGIPEDAFVLVTAGTRLDNEIDDTFIEVILPIFKRGAHIVFAGYFDRYTHFCEKYSELKEHSTFVGYCDDILALMEICDLYVNPKRLGGGFSMVEAFHEGKPGVTINYGDIAAVAGVDFIVNNYEEMSEKIKKYIDDKQFYIDMSKKAIARESVLTDSAAALKDIIDKIQSSPLFF